MSVAHAPRSRRPIPESTRYADLADLIGGKSEPPTLRHLSERNLVRLRRGYLATLAGIPGFGSADEQLRLYVVGRLRAIAAVWDHPDPSSIGTEAR